MWQGCWHPAMLWFPLHVSSPSLVDTPKITLWHEGRSPDKDNLLVTSSDLVTCHFWLTKILRLSETLQSPPPTHTVTTDVSSYGWGRCTCSHLAASGVCVWLMIVESSVYSPCQFFKTVFFALKKFQRWLCGSTHVLVQMDSLLHYLNRVRGTRSKSLDMKVKYSVVSNVKDFFDGPYFRLQQLVIYLRIPTSWSAIQKMLHPRVTTLLFGVWDHGPNNKMKTVSCLAPGHSCYTRLCCTRVLLYMYPSSSLPPPPFLTLHKVI